MFRNFCKFQMPKQIYIVPLGILSNYLLNFSKKNEEFNYLKEFATSQKNLIAAVNETDFLRIIEPYGFGNNEVYKVQKL